MKDKIGGNAYIYQSPRRSGKSLAELLAREKLVEMVGTQPTHVIVDEWAEQQFFTEPDLSLPAPIAPAPKA